MRWPDPKIFSDARAARAVVFDDLLRDWDAEDIRQFTTYLHAFAGEVRTNLLEHVERPTL